MALVSKRATGNDRRINELREWLERARAQAAREEARALALEAELARVRAEAETVREFYEAREVRAQERIIELRTRLGGEMLRADKVTEERDRARRVTHIWRLNCREAQIQEMLLDDELERERAEIARLCAEVARLQSTPFAEEGAE